MRHWLRQRVALTRPNFGSDSSTSKTFAVIRYSGGRVSTSRADTSPAFSSRFSRARSTRTAFARRSASMRWSSDRSGAWVGIFWPVVIVG